MMHRDLPYDPDYKFKKGDQVSVYSLQSFTGPGFYYGSPGEVTQDQGDGRSVIVNMFLLPLTASGISKDRESYEIYPQQLRLRMSLEERIETLEKIVTELASK